MFSHLPGLNLILCELGVINQHFIPALTVYLQPKKSVNSSENRELNVVCKV